MAFAETDKLENERGNALAWSLTTMGGALFLLGFLRLIFRFDYSADPAPALLLLRLAGWFAVTGWALTYFPFVGRWGRRVCRAARTWSRAPSDGVLEILVGGLIFIVVLLIGMVSLWSRTVR